MGSSLLDQLKNAGLVDEKKARKAKQDKHKQTKKKGKGKKGGQPDASKLKAQQAMAEMAAKDRALNKKKKAAAEHKAIQAQIRQLVQQNKIEKAEGNIAYNFANGTKVERIFVNTKIQDQLAQGKLAIVSLDGNYELVPTAVAKKIKSRSVNSVIFQSSSQGTSEKTVDDDPYGDFKVPDDLIW